MDKKYYSMVQNGDVATINIYGDITSFPLYEGEISADNLSKQLEQLNGVSKINVYINSYGGEVSEGLAIYNALRRHKAKITTVCDGFACSIASVIFMAGDKRIMNEASLLMIHNAWTFVQGNAQELRKQADDLEKITQTSVNAYKARSTLSEEEIKALMDAETWILPEEAVSYGFATAIEKSGKEYVRQSAKLRVLEIIKKYRSELEDEEEPEAEPEEEPENPDVENPDTEEEPEEEPEEVEEEETPEAEPDEGEADEEPEEETEEEETAQRWSGFFNALIKNI